MSHSSNRLNGFTDSPDSPEGLADRIAEIIGCPVTIEDSNHRIVSYSKHEHNVDEARTATIMRRKVPERVINGLWKHGVMSKLFESGEPVVVPPIDEIGLGNRIAVSVRKNKDMLGFIWAQANDVKITDHHLELIKDAAQLVSHHLLHHQLKKRKSEENQKEFFWQLLTGTLRHKSEIVRHAKRFRTKITGQLCVAVFEFDENMNQSVERHAYYLTETLQQTRIVSRLFDENQLILLVRSSEEEDAARICHSFITDFTQKMRERLQFEDVKGSFGSIYDSPEYVSDSYKQALKVLELKNQFPKALNHVFSYQDLGFYQFINELASLRSREQYQNAFLKKLYEYDERNKSELVTTLRVYLSCNSNVHKASEQMHIHTNTLNYRLKRIKEIGSIDLKDPNQKTTLYLDLLIDEMERDDL
ncbi:helix-turn-helix domain-containing protein [Halobacillus shinanisalinarum]|uniref:Helix-turn-helix domain-containing protein n=1 Tax=Halobacillus shinanisalinarum TaxID=2932258 RepID=A0ABY4GVN5_9BACI|nr:helix-turn-helix domain-containing protein [Halobacillus shinanisalinarum]UOQ92168.1 helix-turn-helix domain-containing protein [Halobacillus shinanisalinarum]